MRSAHEAWQDVIDVNLTGVFNTVETAIPSMIERGQGGAIVLTSSTAGINGIGGASRAAWVTPPPSTASSASCAPTPTPWPRTASG